jgi:hypothetical protein
MTRRFGVVSRVDKRADVWMLRAFRATLEGAQVAQVETAAELIELGWPRAEISIITFEAEGLSRFESYRALAAAASGELAIQAEGDNIRYLDMKPVSGWSRIARQLVDA